MALYVETGYVTDGYSQDSVSINWGTKVIFVPKTFLTLVQTTPHEIYDLDINEFRLKLKDLEDNVLGVTYLKTNDHNTEVSLGGLTYARVVEILEPYTITFEDGEYSVNLVGANSNIGDKINLNQVSVRSNNSAGLISSTAIEYSSFQGGVIIDVNSGISGTLFPRGTEQAPVNNIEDALLIALFRGFKTLYINSDLEIIGDYDLKGFVLHGKSHVNTQVIITAQSQIDDATIIDCEVSGVMDGNTTIRGCVVGDLNFFNGHIHTSSLYGRITLGGGLDAYMNNISSNNAEQIPVIDMGGSGQSLAIPNYSGVLSIENLNDNTRVVGIGLESGGVILNSATVTSGTVVISGIGFLVDENNNRILSGVWNNNVNVQNNLVNRYTISEATQLGTGVYVNVNGVSGTTFPIGSKRTPVNNLVDAVTIAENLGIEDLYFSSDFTFDSSVYITDYKLIGEGSLETIFTFESGSVIAQCSISDATLQGLTTGFIEINKCLLRDIGSVGLVASSQNILVNKSLFEGNITLSSNYSGTLTVIDCYSNVPGNNTPVLDFGNSSANAQFRNYTGGLEFVNLVSGNTISVDLVSGNLKLNDNVTDANITARGVGKMISSTTGEHIPTGLWNGGVNINNDIMSQGTVSEAVWDEPLVNHTVAGTTGRILSLTAFNGKVWMSDDSGVVGTEFPIGTQGHPSSVGADAITIANRENIDEFRLDGEFVSTQNLSGFTIGGDTWLDDSLIFNNTTYDEMIFRDLYISGVIGGFGDKIQFKNCYIENIDNLSGELIGCRLSNNIKVEAGKTLSGVELVIEGDFTVIDLGGVSGTTVSLDVNSGYIVFKNAVEGCLINLNFKGGEIELDVSCTGGDFYAEGIASFFNDSAMNITGNHLLSKESISDAVWNKTLP